MDVIDQSKHIETLRFLLFAFHYYLFCYSHGFSFSSWFVNFDKVIVFRDEVNKYSAEELMIMKTQDIGYVFQKWQSEKNKIDKLTASLQCTGDQSSRRHVYYAEDREEARELEVQGRSKSDISTVEIPKDIKKYVSEMN
jgi:hypothetical protein